MGLIVARALVHVGSVERELVTGLVSANSELSVFREGTSERFGALPYHRREVAYLAAYCGRAAVLKLFGRALPSRELCSERLRCAMVS